MEIIQYQGETIDTDGIFAGLPVAEYHAQCCDGPSISSSGLRRLFSQSPAHFWLTARDLNPKAEPDAPTKAMTLGRAAHHLLLGEDDFSTLFVCRPYNWDSWRTKEAQAWRETMEAEGRTVLIPEELDHIRGMARSLAGHPLVAAGILNGRIETSLIWRDPATGIWLKGRPDALPNDSGDHADLKTAASVASDDLERAIGDYLLPMQAALIAEGWEHLTGQKVTSFSWVFVETKPPYCCRVVTAKDGDLDRGRAANREAVKLFARCLERGLWPGPGGYDAQFLGMTTWAAERMDYRTSRLLVDYER